MASLGSILKTVGRGAMKGVLGFDDRDVRSKFARRGKDAIGKVEQANRDYGFANLNPALRTEAIDGVEELPEDPELAAAVAADEPTEPVDNFGMPEPKIGYGESAPGLDFGEGGFTRGDATGKTGMEMAGPRKMGVGGGRPKVGPSVVGMPSVAPGLPSAAPPGLKSVDPAELSRTVNLMRNLNMPPGLTANQFKPTGPAMGMNVPGAEMIMNSSDNEWDRFKRGADGRPDPVSFAGYDEAGKKRALEQFKLDKIRYPNGFPKR